jgi:hypothetical protein
MAQCATSAGVAPIAYNVCFTTSSKRQSVCEEAVKCDRDSGKLSHGGVRVSELNQLLRPRCRGLLALNFQIIQVERFLGAELTRPRNHTPQSLLQSYRCLEI